MSGTSNGHDKTSLRRPAEHGERLAGRSTRDLVRLSAFPEENANPIVETESTRAITYLNPAARTAFPDLPSAGFRHPALLGLELVVAELEATEQRFLVREVVIGERVYEQHISAARSGPVIRIYMNEVTARKEAEDALRRYGERQRAVLEINNAIVANLDRTSLFAALAQAPARALCFDRAALTLLSPTRDGPTVHELAADPNWPVSSAAAERPDERTRNRWVLEHRRPMRVGDLLEESRSAFRDWAAERTSVPRLVAEAALAHVIPDKVEAAYFRSDLFDQRPAAGTYDILGDLCNDDAYRGRQDTRMTTKPKKPDLRQSVCGRSTGDRWTRGRLRSLRFCVVAGTQRRMGLRTTSHTMKPLTRRIVACALMSYPATCYLPMKYDVGRPS